jgi:hypothetical protein
MVHHHPLPSQQHQQAPITEATPDSRQLSQSGSDIGIIKA